MNPTVSVVIPTYNSPDLLMETVGYVLAQTFTDYELIVVDDGSTDDTPARLAPLAEAGRIRYVRQANGGIGVARNRGIDESRGTFVCPLDHDDIWLPRKLEVQVAYHRAHPELVSSSVQWASSVRPDRPMIDRAAHRCDARGFAARPVQSTCFVTACLMFHRERCAGLRYETRRGACEDMPFQWAMLNRGPFGVASEEILTIYRVHVGNESGRSSYYANSVRFLRELQREGRFDAYAPDDRRAIDETITSASQQAFARLILDRRRSAAAALLAEQAPHLWRARRLRFLAIAPLALVAPRALVRHRWRPDPVLP
jgi:glycosyltransferase involved in cell wall biosynthesis